MLVIDEPQIVCDAILEDINNFLNSGEIPLLFSLEEVIQLLGNKDMIYNDADKLKMWMRFLRNCKDNLTILLCMSPSPQIFRMRVRRFPALVNCTIIDWF